MKIVIIGGGPGGLYFALLMKKRFPDYDMTVHERNSADDTFGFGVVFSDETLDNLMDYDRGVLRQRSPASSPIGTRSTSTSTARSCAPTGHGFCGTERRTLLDGAADALPRARRQAASSRARSAILTNSPMPT